MPRLKIPVTSIPEGKLCRIEELDINNENPSDVTREKRENYAKMAPLMFCPFREELDDLKHEGSYWQKFDAFRKKYYGEGKTEMKRFEIPPKTLNVKTIRDEQYLSIERILGDSGGTPDKQKKQ
eukprot:scaffold20578_cov109-Skeletonema_dohrnii-CCMP3373.AAC.1